MFVSCQLLCVFILYALSCSHNPPLSHFHHLQKCSRDVDGGEDGNDEIEEPQDEEDGEETETVGAKATPKNGVFEYEECGDDECET